jgi:Ca2+/H+ antiporter
MVTTEFIDATNKTGISARENASVSTPAISSPSNQYFLFSGIVLACLFLLFLMFLWIKRTQKKYLILKNQNEELLCQISKDQKKRRSQEPLFI